MVEKASPTELISNSLTLSKMLITREYNIIRNGDMLRLMTRNNLNAQSSEHPKHFQSLVINAITTAFSTKEITLWFWILKKLKN